MKPDKINLVVEIPIWMREMLDEIAEEQMGQISQVVRLAIRRYLIDLGKFPQSAGAEEALAP